MSEHGLLSAPISVRPIVLPATQSEDSMPPTPKDFRSDTVTRPGPAMRAAMAAAVVGDDVWGEDPTVIELQDRVAERLGKEAALFVPSGTMSNLIGVRLHCRPGEAMICEAQAHLYFYEQAGYAQVNGVAARPLQGLNGVLRLEQLEALPEHDNPHFPRTRLLCLENTHNRGGGRIQPYENVETLCGWARRRGLRTHLDGARLWNAAVATRYSPGPVVAAFRHRERLLQQGPRRARGIGAGRSPRPDPRGPAAPEVVRRRHAAGRHPGRGGPVCPRSSRRSPGRRSCQRAEVSRGPASNPRRAAGSGDDRHEPGLLPSRTGATHGGGTGRSASAAAAS